MIWSWIKRFRCLLRGHPGVFREWEWRPTRAMWRERDDAWTCIFCEHEVINPPDTIPTYRVARPQLTPALVGVLNGVIDRHGVEQVRVRGGDPSTRVPRSPRPASTETV
jgi:hypothetical protein